MTWRTRDMNISTTKADRVETVAGIYPKGLSCIRIGMQKLEFGFTCSGSSKCNGGTCERLAEVKRSARWHRETL